MSRSASTASFPYERGFTRGFRAEYIGRFGDRHMTGKDEHYNYL